MRQRSAPQQGRSAESVPADAVSFCLTVAWYAFCSNYRLITLFHASKKIAADACHALSKCKSPPNSSDRRLRSGDTLNLFAGRCSDREARLTSSSTKAAAFPVLIALAGSDALRRNIPPRQLVPAACDGISFWNSFWNWGFLLQKMEAVTRRGLTIRSSKDPVGPAALLARAAPTSGCCAGDHAVRCHGDSPGPAAAEALARALGQAVTT